MIYAVIKAGGREEKVVPGQRLTVDRLSGVDEQLRFVPVLVVREEGELVIGEDLANYPVEAKVIGEARGPKIRGFKYKAKTGYRRRWGHRQELTEIEITRIGDVVADSDENADDNLEEVASDISTKGKKSFPRRSRQSPDRSRSQGTRASATGESRAKTGSSRRARTDQERRSTGSDAKKEEES